MKPWSNPGASKVQKSSQEESELKRQAKQQRDRRNHDCVMKAKGREYIKKNFNLAEKSDKSNKTRTKYRRQDLIK